MKSSSKEIPTSLSVCGFFSVRSPLWWEYSLRRFSCGNQQTNFFLALYNQQKIKTGSPCVHTLLYRHLRNSGSQDLVKALDHLSQQTLAQTSWQGHHGPFVQSKNDFLLRALGVLAPGVLCAQVRLPAVPFAQTNKAALSSWHLSSYSARSGSPWEMWAWSTWAAERRAKGSSEQGGHRKASHSETSSPLKRTSACYSEMNPFD